MRVLLQRLGLVLGIAAVAVLCLSSAYLAAAIGVVTAVVVVIDSLVFAPRTPPTDPVSVVRTRRR